MYKKEKTHLSLGNAALVFLSLVTIFFIMRFPDVAIEYMRRGLSLSVSVVIPSLFPFMVVSELIVLLGASSYFAKPFGRIFRRIFGIGGEGATAYFLGTLCGFPIGTRVAVSLYKKGKISFDELQRLILFSNNPSSAFVISAVGVTLFGSREFGVVLYFITLVSSLIIGIGQKVLCSSQKGVALTLSLASESENCRRQGIASFSRAVSSAASSMLSVCAFVVFFSTFTGTLGEVLSYFRANESLSALIFSIFELTSGTASAACLEDLGVAILVAAFAVGWSGLSVHLQVISICEVEGVSFGRYFLSKLLQGIFNVLLMWIYMILFPNPF